MRIPGTMLDPKSGEVVVKRGPGRPPKNGYAVEAALASAAQVNPGAGTKRIAIPRIQTEVISFDVFGVTDLIQHAMGAKSGKQIRDYEERKPGEKRKKDPRTDDTRFEEFVDACHWMPGSKHPGKKLKIGQAWPFRPNTFGIPAVSFKHAAEYVAATCGLNTKDVKAKVHVIGDLIPLKYDRCVMREDYVRVGKFNDRRATLRYRPGFPKWGCRLTVRFLANAFSREDIINLFEYAGLLSGMGEWRPSSPTKSGEFGIFTLNPKNK